MKKIISKILSLTLVIVTSYIFYSIPVHADMTSLSKGVDEFANSQVEQDKTNIGHHEVPLKTGQSVIGSTDLSNGTDQATSSPISNGHWFSFATTPEVTTTTQYHVSEDYTDGNFRFNFYVDKIIGPFPYAIDIQLIALTEPSITGPVTSTKTMPISKVGAVGTGLVGSVEVPAKTTFLAISGAYGVEDTTGNVHFFTIMPGAVVLQNKKAENFPVYTDPKSGKNAANIRTDWVALASSPKWYGRNQYKKMYDQLYGEQSEDWWKLRQIHHIQPRKYGGSDDFSNLMPVLVPEHQAITTWFNSY